MAKDTVRVLAFDPGINFMGWALLEYRCSTGAITVLKYGTLNGTSLTRKLKELLQLYTKSFVTLEAYEMVIEDMIREMKPDEVVSEDAFFHKFPQTYGSLLLIIHTIRRMTRKTLNKAVHIVAPMETKKVITGKGNRVEKQDMRDGVLNRTHVNLLEVDSFPLEKADEHAIDAIGHGTTFIVKFLPDILSARLCEEIKLAA